MRQSVANFFQKNSKHIIAAATIVALYLILFAFGITCPIKFLTGVSCPGCGMSRACMHALKLDFASAFAFHPLWIALPFAAFFFIFFYAKKMKRAFRITLSICVIALLTVYLIRIFSGDSTVVVFAPQNSFIYRAVRALIALFN